MAVLLWMSLNSLPVSHLRLLLFQSSGIVLQSVSILVSLVPFGLTTPPPPAIVTGCPKVVLSLRFHLFYVEAKVTYLECFMLKSDNKLCQKSLFYLTSTTERFDV